MNIIRFINSKKSLYLVGNPCAKSKPFPIIKIFKFIPHSTNNTIIIAHKVNVKINLNKKIVLPI